MSRRLILFAPGAGAPSSHPWMQNWKRRLSEIGEVETFDYDYMRAGRKRPDPLPQLIAAHRAALEAANREETSTGHRHSLSGKAWAAGSDVTCRSRKKSTAWFVVAIRFARWAITENFATKCVR